MNRWLMTFLGALALGGVCLVVALSVPEEPPEPSDFLRFASETKGQETLETASVTYRRRDGAEVTLIGAVHVGEREYYRRLQEEFTTYDALLYEMVHEEGARPTGRSDSLLSTFQRGLQQLLGLEFQLDAIDYSPPNFVHADLDPETFLRLQAERGETILSLLFKAMLAEWKRQGEGEGSQLNAFHLLGALASRDRARSLKLLLAREFEGIEALVAGVEEGGDGRGTVLLSGRNEKAISVLLEQLDAGRRRLAIFYGAAHLPDMEERLWTLGFRKVEERWLVAWDMRRRAGVADPESERPDEPEAR